MQKKHTFVSVYPLDEYCILGTAHLLVLAVSIASFLLNSSNRVRWFIILGKF